MYLRFEEEDDNGEMVPINQNGINILNILNILNIQNINQFKPYEIGINYERLGK